MAGQGIYPIQYKAPYLGDIYKIAKNTGRNQGLISALEGELDFRRDLYKKRVDEQAAAAKKRAAAVEASSDPQNESFWDKLDQFGKDIVDKQEHALGWVFDKIQRPMSGVINAYEEAQNQAYDENRSAFDLSGTGKVIDQFWKGVTGAKPNSFAQVIAREADENPNKNAWDNKWVQAGAGFIGDVALDPLSYVGAGLVTRPLKAAGKVQESSRINGLARELEGLKIKPTGDDILPGRDKDLPLNYDELRVLLGHQPQGARKVTASAQRAKNVQRVTENLPKLKKWIREQPDLDVPDTLKKIDHEIERVKAQRTAILDQAGTEAYSEALKEFDRTPKLWPQRPKGKSVLRPEDSAVGVTRISKAFEKAFFDGPEKFDEILGEGWKLDKRISPEFRANARETVEALIKKDSSPVVRRAFARNNTLKKDIENAQRDLREAKTPEAKKTAQDALVKAKQARSRNAKDISAAKAAIFAKLVNFEITKNTKHFGGYLGKLKANEAQAIKAVNDAGSKAEKAVATQRLEEIRTQIKAATEGDELSGLMAREWELRHLLSKQGKAGTEYEVAGHVPNSEEGFLPKTITSEDDRGKLISEGSYNQDKNIEVRTSHEIDPETESILSNPAADLERELADVQKQIERKMKDPIFTSKTRVGRPEGMPENFKVTDHWLNNKISDPKVAEFQRAVKVEVEALEDDLFKSKLETHQRRVRERRLEDVLPKHTLDRLRKMFAPPAKRKHGLFASADHVKENFGQPYITIDGVKVYRTGNSPEAKEALAKYISTEDAAKASAASAPKAGSATSKKISQLEDELSVARTSADNIDNDVAMQAHWDKEVTRLTEELDNILKGGNAAVKAEYQTFERLFKQQHGITLKSAMKVRSTAMQDVRKAFAEKPLATKNVTKEVEANLRKEAHDDALRMVNKEIDNGSFKASTHKDVNFEAFDEDSVDDVYAVLKEQERMNYAQQKAALINEAGVNQVAKAELDAQLEALKKDYHAALDAHNRAYRIAIKTRKEMETRLNEQSLLDALEENITHQGNHLKLTFAGATIGEFRSPVKLMEKMGHLPIIAQANKVWASGFKPASAIEPELNLARLRAQANTPQIIKHHVDEIRHRFSEFKPEERKAVLKSLKSGVPVGNSKLYDSMEEYFGELLPYLQGRTGITDEFGNLIDKLKVSEINRYLPEHFKFSGEKSKYVDSLNFNSVQDVIENMRNLPHNEDAMKVMWNLRISIEQALSNKALGHTIKKMYGVEKPGLLGEGGAEVADAAKLVDALAKEHGWRTVNEFGPEHFFAPEVADDIEKLLDMMKPQHVHRIMQNYDKAIRAWKSAVTVYNPGYYTRNAIGETIMSWFDGMTNPKWHFKSARVIKYAMPDAMEDTLKHLEPWKRHQTLNQKGAAPVMTLRNGKTLSAEDVWVLYNDVGLKSGFISSEFDHYFPAGSKVKSSAVGQKATALNDKVRDKGEKFEDYFRLSHFMYRMAKSRHTNPLKAAEEAAGFVRKYHFDYTDFTPFEKSTMLRLFPFYKWTRKAMPLMASMLFTQPGKAMAYPKFMQNLSYGSGGTDPLQDTNGILPNYEEVTPQWMKTLMTYPIGKDSQDAMTYMNVATPQFDVYKMLADPVGTTSGMLSPVPKNIIEQTIGHPLDPEFAGMQMEGSQDRFNSLMRNTPFTNLVNRSISDELDPNKESSLGEPGGLDERLVSFLTGLGFYENSESRQQGELIRRREANK